MEKNTKIVGVRDLRQNLENYILEVKKGKSFTIVRRSSPVFQISPVGDQEMWEEAADFTKIKKGGIKINEILSRI